MQWLLCDEVITVPDVAPCMRHNAQTLHQKLVISAWHLAHTTSASESSFSNCEFSPSLSSVTTNVWPRSSRNFLSPNSFSRQPVH